MQKTFRETERRRHLTPRADDVRSSESDEGLVDLAIKREATVSPLSSILKVKPSCCVLNSEQKAFEFFVNSSLTQTTLESSEFALTQMA